MTYKATGMSLPPAFAAVLDSFSRRRDKLVQALRLFRSRIADRHFWITQALVAAVTAVHYGVEATNLAGSELGLHDIPVVVYVIPVIYASLHFGFEGGVLTGVGCLLLSLPNMVFWHHHEYE